MTSAKLHRTTRPRVDLTLLQQTLDLLRARAAHGSQSARLALEQLTERYEAELAMVAKA